MEDLKLNTIFRKSLRFSSAHQKIKPPNTEEGFELLPVKFYKFGEMAGTGGKMGIFDKLFWEEENHVRDIPRTIGSKI